MNEPISIKEIVAMLLKRGKTIIIAGLITAVLACGVQLLMQWRATPGALLSEAEREMEYQNAMQAYETERITLQAQIDSLGEYIQGHQDYANADPFMQIDATYRPTSQMCMLINNVQTGQEDANYIQVLTDPKKAIADMYSLIWNNADLVEELSRYTVVPFDNSVLREMVSFTYYPDNATVILRADARTPEESRMLCDAAYNFILSIQDTVCNTSFSHTLDVLTNIDDFFDDPALWEQQVWRLEQIQNGYDECDMIRLQMESMVVPVKIEPVLEPDVTAIAKWGVLGAVVGILLSCVAILSMFIVHDHVANSRQMAAILAVPYLGSVAKIGDIWNRMALNFTNEPHWDRVEDGERYLAENVAARLHENTTVAVVSTLNKSEQDAAVERVIGLLRKQGHKVTYINNANCNSDVMRAIQDNQYVIFAEAAGKSSRTAVRDVKELVCQLSGQILGFLFV